MSARDDHPILAQVHGEGSMFPMSREAGKALDELDRLRAEVERMRRWQYEACLAIEAASTISQRWATTGSGLNLGNHDRLLAEAGFSPDSAVAALDAGGPAVRLTM